MSLPLNPVGTELLDGWDADPAVARRSLANIARANRWFGGRAAVRWALGTLEDDLRTLGRCTVADIGAGAGDLGRDAMTWLRTRGIPAWTVSLDPHAEAARMSRALGPAAVRGDAGWLPLADRSADVVLVSQLLHHFSEDAATRILAEARRTARLAVIVADLRPSAVARAAFRVGAAVLRFDADTRADGLTSLRRAYAARSLAALLQRAGLRASVRQRPGWRLVAVARVGGVT